MELDDTSDLDRYEIESADAEEDFVVNVRGLLFVAELDKDIELQEQCEDVIAHPTTSEHLPAVLEALGYKN